MLFLFLNYIYLNNFDNTREAEERLATIFHSGTLAVISSRVKRGGTSSYKKKLRYK